MKHLFVVAHPDDEVLGAGGFIHKAIKNKDEVLVIILNADYEKTRKEMFSDIEKSHKVLGITEHSLYSYKNMSFWNENHREIVETIEKEIDRFQPDNIFTHFDGDIHTDHKIVSYLTQQAARRWQREGYSSKINKPRALYFMEVLSSTNWGSVGFVPDTYEKISADDLEKKIESLEKYKNVVRPSPHPRSEECIKSLAILRGSNIGYDYAEAFKTCWRGAI